MIHVELTRYEIAVGLILLAVFSTAFLAAFFAWIFPAKAADEEERW